jgi:hypothetical protein
MRMKNICYLLLATAVLTACNTTPTASPTPQIVDVYATASTQSWLNDLYTCAAQQSVVVRLADSESAAQINLRIGEPVALTTPTYQIGSEDILIVTHRESPVQNLSADEAYALFAQGQSNVQVWVFSEGEDVQQAFEAAVMRGMPITSQARLATSPQQMSDTLNADKNAVGILPRHWKAGTVRDVFTISNVPVLAIVKAQPPGVIKDMLTCLQK